MSIVIRSDDEGRLRYGWEQWSQTRRALLRPRTFEQWLSDLVTDLAESFPEPPKPPPMRRTLSQVREEARLRNGGTSPYTEELQTIRTSIRPPDQEQP